jgi:hypothetical protein
MSIWRRPAAAKGTMHLTTFPPWFLDKTPNPKSPRTSHRQLHRRAGTACQNRTLGAGGPSRDAARMTISRLYPASNDPYLQREIILE